MKKIVGLILIVLISAKASMAMDKPIFIGLSGFVSKNTLYLEREEFRADFFLNSNLAYGYGVAALLRINERMSFKTGLLYSYQGIRVNYTEHDVGNGHPILLKHTDFSTKQLSIPIEINYKILDRKRFAIRPSIGFYSSLLISNSENTVSENDEGRSTNLFIKDLNKFHFSAHLGFGFEYEINEKILITFNPFIRKGINKLNNKIMRSSQVLIGTQLVIFYNL